jgi:hypothetical protein
MRYTPDQHITIHLPTTLFDEMVGHCLRKLQGKYVSGEGHAPKAFGLIGGKIEKTILSVETIIPLLKNARDCGERKAIMDTAMNRHAVASETPLDQRGWVAEPKELDAALATLQSRGLRLLGNYHMHRVAWAHDHQRDTPTELDTVLGKDSRMLMFIIAMVNPEAPTIRAFFEGVQTLELPITIL